MARSYPAEIREGIVSFIEAGHSKRAAALHFGVSEGFAVNLMQRVARTGELMPRRQGRKPGSGKLGVYADFLIATVERRPAITMAELAARLHREYGVRFAPITLSRFLYRRGFRYGKDADGTGVRIRHQSCRKL